MATIQSIGGIPGGKITNGDILGKLLEAGILGNNQAKKEMYDKKQSMDDVIKAGIGSKTMRPAKDDEKSDFRDSSGRGWIYDDSGLKEQHEQATKLRQGTMWQNMIDRGYQAAQRNGLQFGTSEYDTFVKQFVAHNLGSTNGKFTDSDQERVKDVYGDSAIDWLSQLDKGGSPTRTPADANIPHPALAGNPGALEALAGIFNKVNLPGFMPPQPGQPQPQGFQPPMGVTPPIPGPMTPQPGDAQNMMSLQNILQRLGPGNQQQQQTQ